MKQRQQEFFIQRNTTPIDLNLYADEAVRQIYEEHHRLPNHYEEIWDYAILVAKKLIEVQLPA